MEAGFLSAAIGVNLLLAVILFTRANRTLASVYFATSASFIVVWSVGALMTLYSPTEQQASIGLILFLVAPTVTTLFMVLFVREIAGASLVGRQLSAITYALFTILLLTYLSLRLDTSQVVMIAEGGNLLNFQHPWFIIYGIYFAISFFVAYLYLLKAIVKKRRTSNLRHQLITVLVGISGTSLVAVVTNVIFPSFGMTQYVWIGPSVTLIYIVATSIAMARYRLFDLRQAAALTFTYILSLGVLAIVYFLLAIGVLRVLFPGQVYSIESNLISGVMALVLAFLFQPIRGFFDKLTEQVFYQGTYKVDQLFSNLTRTLTTSTNLQNLLEVVAYQLANALKSKNVFFIVYSRSSRQDFEQIGFGKYRKLSYADTNYFDDYVTERGSRPIVDSEDLDESIHRLMVSYRLDILVPLADANGLIGYIGLGEHQLNSYSTRDIKVLDTISNELVIAIENALSLQEVQNLNSTLQQRVDNATKELRESNAQLQKLDEVKDEFMSMASHQLRTPLTSIKGYISMLLDGDAGKLNNQQKKLLQEAFISSERMVHLIGDFLNISRLQTGKFILERRPVDLGKIVQDEVNNLIPNATARGFKFVVNISKNIPLVNVDEAKMRQVIMNFADNAVFYSHDGSTIRIRLHKSGNQIIYTVRDYGIGVPDIDKHYIFNKFFRAENARKQRPDGTGIGLYLAKRIIDAHNGQLIFESSEGKGSKFGFRLNLKDVAVPKRSS